MNGEKRRILAAVPGGRAILPVTEITGAAPGPSVLITAGIHGGEYPGMAASMELAAAADVFRKPEHPYTRALMAAVPKFTVSAAAGDRLFAIPGIVPDPSEIMAGCRFAPRCPFATEICRTAPPVDTLTGAGHLVYCHNWQSAMPAIGVIHGKEADA